MDNGKREARPLKHRAKAEVRPVPPAARPRLRPYKRTWSSTASATMTRCTRWAMPGGRATRMTLDVRGDSHLFRSLAHRGPVSCWRCWPSGCHREACGSFT